MAENNQTYIGEFERNATEKVVGTIGEYQGKQRVDLRIYYQPDADNWYPTKKGINLGLDNWKDFKDLMGRVDDALSKGKWGGHPSLD